MSASSAASESVVRPVSASVWQSGAREDVCRAVVTQVFSGVTRIFAGAHAPQTFGVGHGSESVGGFAAGAAAHHRHASSVASSFHIVNARRRRTNARPGQRHSRFFQVVERTFGDAVLRLEVGQERVPERILREYAAISDNDETEPSSGESDVEASRIVQESDALVVVGSYARQHDDVLLSSLKRVDGCNFDFVVRRRTERTGRDHVTTDVGSLSLVGRDHADLAGLETGLEEERDNFFDRGRLAAIQKRGSRPRHLFASVAIVEKHRSVGRRPRKLGVLSGCESGHGPLGLRNAIL